MSQLMAQFPAIGRSVEASGLADQPGALLYSGIKTLKPGPVYLLGYNPGGDPKVVAGNIRSAMVNEDTAHWNEYMCGDWSTPKRKYPPGGAPLQQRVRILLEALELRVRDVCASNLIFVRSSAEGQLVGARDLAEACWPVHCAILDIVRPGTIICYSAKTWNFLRAKATATTETRSKPAGHGNWHCMQLGMTINGRDTKLIYVPHLSRYAIDQHPDVLDWIGEEMSLAA